MNNKNRGHKIKGRENKKRDKTTAKRRQHIATYDIKKTNQKEAKGRKSNKETNKRRKWCRKRRTSKEGRE